MDQLPHQLPLNRGTFQNAQTPPVTIGAHNLQITQCRFGASRQFRERALVMTFGEMLAVDRKVVEGAGFACQTSSRA